MKPNIFLCELLGPSLIINLAQLVSPSVALPADLVLFLVNMVELASDILKRTFLSFLKELNTFLIDTEMCLQLPF